MYVRVPSKGAVTVRVQLEGAIAPGATYELDTLLQPMVNPDHVRARLTLDGSWRLAGGSKIASADWTMTESHTLRARACRTDGNPFVRFRQSC
jgi:hypothetical protein